MINNCLQYFFGGIDPLMIILFIFMIMDLLATIMEAIIIQKIPRKNCLKFLFKKILILFIIGMSVSMDSLFSNVDLRSMVILFYILNQGLSIINKANKLGVPIPKKIQIVLDKLYNENNGK